jgi:hypothetical protein
MLSNPLKKWMEMQDKAIPSSLAREFLPLEGGNVGDCFVFVTNHTLSFTASFHSTLARAPHW